MTDLDTVNKSLEDMNERISGKFDALESKVTDLSAGYDEINRAIDEDRKARVEEAKNSSGFLRAESKNKAVDGLTPAQLLFAREMIDPNKQRDLYNDITDEIVKLEKISDVERENHYSAVLEANKGSERMLKQGLVMERALTTGAGTPKIPGAEMYPIIASQAMLWPRIPTEPMLETSGQVASIAPFTDQGLSFVVDETTNVTDADNAGASVDLVAKNGRSKATVVADSYLEDYAFGDAVTDIMEPTLRGIGPRLDAIVAYGDAEDANNFNGTDANFAFMREFNGFGNVVNSGSAADGGGTDSLKLEHIDEVVGAMGVENTTPKTNLVIVSSEKQLLNLSSDAATAYMMLDGSDTPVNLRRVGSVYGMPLVPVDYAVSQRDATTGRVVAVAASNRSVAIVANLMNIKGGFSRAIGVTSRELPQGNGRRLWVTFRWAQNVARTNAASKMETAGLVRNLG